MSARDRDLLALVAAGLCCLDALFVGILPASMLALLGRGGWYSGPGSGERVVYRGRHGVEYASIHFMMPSLVLVSDPRLVVRLAWSRAVLLNIPLQSIAEVATGRRWFLYPFVMVRFIELRTDTARGRGSRHASARRRRSPPVATSWDPGSSR